ncbi:YqaA family protein [Acuticoccus sp.]|uniref:YqaA family protein n=1 Tax=Acuticoccus sp. TaxID=1904378 RepID=UPI003B523B22
MATAQASHHPLHRATQRLAHSNVGVGLLSMGESTVVPIPLEAVIVPLMVAYPRRAWAIAVAALVGCLIGATLFYYVGHLLFEPVVAPLLDALSLRQSYEEALAEISGSGYFWAVFLVSVGPVPLQLATLGAGATDAGYAVFISAIAVSRAIRYLGLALLCNLLGQRVQRLNVPRWVTITGGIAFLLAVWAGLTFLL